MKKFQDAILKKAASVIKRVSLNGAQTTCWWTFYQPDIPEQLREKIIKE